MMMKHLIVNIIYREPRGRSPCSIVALPAFTMSLVTNTLEFYS